MNGIDISRNIKTIEWLKSELLTDISRLYSIMVDSEDDIQEEACKSISNIVIESMMLGRRMGIDYTDIVINIRKKIMLGIEENHEIERYYQDLTELKKVFSKNLK